MQSALLIMPFIVASTIATLRAGNPMPESPGETRESLVLVDKDRQREIPVEIYFPRQGVVCQSSLPCGVALLSGGAGIDHTAYSFLANELNDRSYLVVSVQHQLSSDLPPEERGSVYETRLPVWRRGSENLRFVARTLAAKYPTFDWKHLLLIGHSNGGDISALLATEHPEMVSALVTLDNRRMPIPRVASPKILLVRASDFEADTNVLPSPDEQRKFGISLTKISGAKHDEMNDGGSPELKRSILKALHDFLAPSNSGSTPLPDSASHQPTVQSSADPAKVAGVDASVGMKALFQNDKGEILLVFDDRRQAWEVPGTAHQGQATTTRNLMDAIAGEIGITYGDYGLGGLFTYHNPQSGSAIVRPYYTAKFRGYVDGKGFTNGEKAKWFGLSEAKKIIPYPASVRIVEKLLRDPARVWGGAFEEYGYTSPMTERTAVKFRVIEDFYQLK